MASSDPLLSHCGRKLHLGAKSLKTGRSIFVHAAQVTDAYRKNAAWLAELASGRLFFHHDHVTSTTAVSGHNGGTTQSVKYAAFGAVQSSTGSSPNRLKYTGREDDGTGLMYYRARYYDTVIGRFISEDPIGFASGDMSFYAYAGNSPINYNDPMGTDPLSALGRVAVKIGGRLGSAETREHIIQVANEWKSKGWELISGGGKPEELIRGAAGTAKGGAYGDIVLKNPVTGQQKIINTIDTLADGVTPTVREAANGARIQKLVPDAEFSMVPKPKVIAGVAAAGSAGAAKASDGGIFGSGITWGDIRDFVVDLVVPGGVSQLGGGALYGPGTRYNSYQDYANSFGSQSGAAAGGGFLIYPNKSNNNFSQSVYSK